MQWGSHGYVPSRRPSVHHHATRTLSSDALLHYICKQIKEFSSGISVQMIRNENFFTIPSALADDPRVANHPLNRAS